MTHYTSYAKDVLNKFRAVPKSDGTTFRTISPKDENACFSGVVAKGGVKLSVSGGKDQRPIIQLEINMKDGDIRLTLLKDGDVTHEFWTNEDGQ